MVFKGVEINTSLDHRFRLNIPGEIVKTKEIGPMVFLANVKIKDRLLTRIYYHEPRKTKRFIRVRVEKTKSGHRVTLVKSIRAQSDSFYYEKIFQTKKPLPVMIIDGGDFMEILPWPAY